MRQLLWTVALGVLSVTLTACQQGTSGFSAVSYYGEYDHALDREGRLDGATWYLRRTTAEGPHADTTEEQLALAVGSLLAHEPSTPGAVSYWAGSCAPGRRVQDIDVRDDLVVIRLAERPADHQPCRLSSAERQVQRQQIAWTVLANTDPFGEREPPLVRVIAADGSVWPGTVADPSYIEPGLRAR